MAPVNNAKPEAGTQNQTPFDHHKFFHGFLGSVVGMCFSLARRRPSGFVSFAGDGCAQALCAED